MLKIKTKNMLNVYKQFKNGTSSTVVCVLKKTMFETRIVKSRGREFLICDFGENSSAV